MNNLITHNLIHFLSQCGHAIADLAEDEIHKQGVSEFLLKLESAKGKEFATQRYPVLDLFDDIAETPYTFNFDELATQLKWRPSPRTDPKAKVIALSTLNEMLNLNGLLAGLMFMSPNQIYPEHQHAPQELYFVLSGSADWFYGGEEAYRWQKPGDIIYNQPNDMHAIKTKDESLLALYFLWGNSAETYRY